MQKDYAVVLTVPSPNQERSSIGNADERACRKCVRYRLSGLITGFIGQDRKTVVQLQLGMKVNGGGSGSLGASPGGASSGMSLLS